MYELEMIISCPIPVGGTKMPLAISSCIRVKLIIRPDQAPGFLGYVFVEYSGQSFGK